MPRQLTGSWPATERRFVPEAHGSEGYREKDQLVSMIRVMEKGPDVALVIFMRGLPCTPVLVSSRDESALISRLFREPTLQDRAAFQVVLQGFEDAILGDDVEAKRMAWRRVMAVFDTMAADLHAISGLPNEQRGAA